MNEKLARSAIQPRNPLLNASRVGNLPHVPASASATTSSCRAWFRSIRRPASAATGRLPSRSASHCHAHMLESAGSSLERVVRVHVVLADISHMAEMDRIYREFFRSTRRHAPPGRCSFGSATAARSNAWRWRAESCSPAMRRSWAPASAVWLRRSACARAAGRCACMSAAQRWRAKATNTPHSIYVPSLLQKTSTTSVYYRRAQLVSVSRSHIRRH